MCYRCFSIFHTWWSSLLCSHCRWDRPILAQETPEGLHSHQRRRNAQLSHSCPLANYVASATGIHQNTATISIHKFSFGTCSLVELTRYSNWGLRSIGLGSSLVRTQSFLMLSSGSCIFVSELAWTWLFPQHSLQSLAITLSLQCPLNLKSGAQSLGKTQYWGTLEQLRLQLWKEWCRLSPPPLHNSGSRMFWTEKSTRSQWFWMPASCDGHDSAHLSPHRPSWAPWLTFPFGYD